LSSYFKMKNEDYILYLDMDGVLVDMWGGYKQLKSKDKLKELTGKDRRNAVLGEFFKQGSEFWANLDWIQGGKELWKTANKLFRRVCILSSTGSSNDPEGRGQIIKEGKIKWLNKNIPELSHEEIFIVHGKHLKQRYSSEFSILIDDMAVTIVQWNLKGGIGILHKASEYKNTIKKLNQLALPLNLKEILKIDRDVLII